jgi:ABC-type Fe3+ transport system permease subunit
MRKTIATANAISIAFWVLSILLLAVMIAVPFLQIDKSFNVSPSFSLAKVIATWDSSLLSALINSVVLSVVASLFAIACGGLLGRFIERKPIWLFGLMIAVYSINPVARALSYFDLFQLYTPFYDWSIALLGRRSATTIILPALILGMHYLPIYLMRNLFVLKKTNTAHDLPPFLETLFDDIPLWVRGFPISFALFFLLTFFDYWVIRVISGNTVLYWTPLFVQKGFEARSVSEAALMIVIGLVATLLAYLGALVVSIGIQKLLRMLRPLRFAHIKGESQLLAMIDLILSWVALIFAVWPIIATMIKLGIYIYHGEAIVFVPNISRGIVTMLLLGIGMGAVSATVAILLSAIYQERPRARQWWLPPLYFLALVPEAAYVLFSLFVTGSGALHANPTWLFFLMASFSIPMSFFLWESLWGDIEKQKLWLVGAALGKKPAAAAMTMIREWSRPWAIVFVVIFWMTIDNVFITDFAGGPQWKPLSAVIFNATKRGFSSDEFYSSVAGTVSVLAIIGLALILSSKGRLSEEK